MPHAEATAPVRWVHMVMSANGMQMFASNKADISVGKVRCHAIEVQVRCVGARSLSDDFRSLYRGVEDGRVLSLQKASRVCCIEPYGGCMLKHFTSLEMTRHNGHDLRYHNIFNSYNDTQIGLCKL